MTTSPIDPPHGPIAVIGLSGRYPGGADTPELLWQRLVDGVDCIGETQGERWDLGWHNPDARRSGRVYTRAGGFMPRIDGFDAEFFGLSPREARQVDPQQRLLLELAWEALEDADIPALELAGSNTGVFIGISSNDYAALEGHGDPDAYFNTGASFAIASNRVSYFLDLHGPSVSLDTACSSGLVAIHQACVSLSTGACGMALVGAASLFSHIRAWQGFSAASMLSPDGRCKSFDASGNGFVRSEGGGVLVLKPLADAQRDGNRILGVIRASGVNSDGRTLGLSMPNVDAQETLLSSVYSRAGIRPEQVGYVEAHGTGTAVGDPIECESIGRVLGAPRQDGSRLLIGSVKSNIGHLEAAAGIAGITKALLVLRHQRIPANLHFKDPNPKIDFESWRLEVADRSRELPRGELPAVVGVNSFGFGGTNAHVVLEEYRAPAAAPDAAAAAAAPAAATEILLLSAQSAPALAELARRHVERFAQPLSAPWGDYCATAALARSPLRHRLAVAGSSAGEAAGLLEAWLAGAKPARVAEAAVPGAGKPKVALVYSGNGPQWWGMGRELLGAVPRFRAVIEEIDAVFVPLAGWSLVAEMARPESDSRMALTEYAQPMLFAEQVALTVLLREAGVAPVACIGHSVGEAAAAWSSGALSLADATRVIYFRSLYQSRTQGMGKMAAVGMGAEELARTIRDTPGWLEIAAWNSPRAATIAGDPLALAQLEATLTAAGKFVRVLALDYPFHTRAMDGIRDPLRESLADLRPSATSIAFVSTVEGRAIAGEELAGDYWWRNVREPVRFEQGIDALLADGIEVFVELGPHPVLRDYVQQSIKARNSHAVALPSLRRPGAKVTDPEPEQLWQLVCACHATGAVDAQRAFRRPAQWAELPHYPWQRASHWRGKVNLPGSFVPIERDHPLLGFRLPAPDGLWENPVDLQRLPWLGGHVVQQAVVFPAAGHIENLFNACRNLLGDGAASIEDFEILRPLSIPATSDPHLQVAMSQVDGSFEVRSRQDAHASEWTTLVRGRCSRSPLPLVRELLNLDALRERLPVEVDGAAHYAECVRRGMDYSGMFQGIAGIRLSAPGAAAREGLAEISLPALDDAALESYLAHPALVDCCIQALITLLAQQEPRPCSIIPVQVGRTTLVERLPNRLFCHVRIVSETARSAVADFDFADADGTVRMTVRGARCQKVEFQQGGPTVLMNEAWQLDPAWPALVPALPSAASVAEIAAAAAPAGRPAAAAWLAAQPAVDTLVGAYVATALEQLGARTGGFDLARLMRRGRVNPDHARLLEEWLAIATAQGQLERTEAGWQWNADHAGTPPAAQWRSLLLGHPELVGELQLIADRGDRLAELSRTDGEDGGGPAGLASLDPLYDLTPWQSAVNAAAVTALRSWLAGWPAEAPLRVLELGAGRGGLTAQLLPVLPPQRTDYAFSDRSEAALGAAEHRFGGASQLRRVRYDFDEAAAAQGLLANGYDLIVAGNCLHESRDLPQALAQLRTLLAPGGLLLVVSALPSRLGDLLCGFDPAWWHGEDFGERGGQRLPSREAWPRLLEAAGFAAQATLDQPEACGAQGLWLAQAGLEAAPAVVAVDAAANPARQRVLLVDAADRDSVLVSSLITRLAAAGPAPRLHAVEAGASLQAAEVQSLLADGGIDELVFLLAADAGALAAGGLASHQRQCMSLVQLVQALTGGQIQHECHLTVVTRGALAPSNGAGSIDPAQAPLWGLARVAASEHPSLECRLIDLHAGDDIAAAAGWLARALLQRDEETEVQLHRGQRYLGRARIGSLAGEARAHPGAGRVEACRLDFLPQGGIDSLHLRSITRRAPQAGEVELRVHAAGLNFRDVLWTMGMLPEEALEHGFSGPTIGMECAAEVVTVGTGVDHLKPGDRVIAFASACFASHVTTSAGSVARIPDQLSLTAAASIPTTFLTAWYALDHLARIEAGEWLLVHGAAGGVGLAAVQIALLKGVRVIGTAGSPAKRRLLAKMGVEHVLDSRSLAFADEVMSLTGGVDVVLNSLAGEAITKGLQILRPFGRFLEIGKRDLYANSRIGLRPFRQNVSYFGIDADTLLVERPALARRVLDQVMAEFAAGRLAPIPHQTFPIERAAEAFRAMQQSRHVGKLVVTVPAVLDGLPVVPADPPRERAGTWLITGGLGGFGLATAHWLAARGVRSLALVGRRGGATPEAHAALATLRAAGVTARDFAVDITDGAALRQMLATIRAEMAPLRGVYHAAVNIEDAPVHGISAELLERVFAAKLLGAANLHHATRGDALEEFVLYSSSAVLVGNPGQASYVAANLYLEALAEARRAEGLPALAVGWGAISDAGFLTRNTHVAEMLRNRSGLDAMSAADALAELGRLLAAGSSRITVARLNLKRLGQVLPGIRVPRFATLIPTGMSSQEVGGEALGPLLLATPEAERLPLVLDRLTRHVGRILATGAAQIDVNRPLPDLGLDSLMAVELAEAVEQDLGKPVSVMQLLGAGNLRAIADLVLRTAIGTGSATGAGAATAEAATPAAGDPAASLASHG